VNAWKDLGHGVWSLPVRPLLLSLYVVRSAGSEPRREAFWPQINGTVARRSYANLADAQAAAVAGARKLLTGVLEELK
jgi:hypothetical protein